MITIPTDSNFLTRVASGAIEGAELVRKFGRNSAVGASFTPIAVGGFYRTPQASSATKLRVKAGNVADSAAGTGARKVYIEGINQLGARTSEILTTAGTSPGANSVNDYMRIYRAYVYESGAYATQAAGSHAAAIVIQNAAGTQDWLTIGATIFPRGQSEVACYTIPIGYTGFIVGASMFTESDKATDLIFFQRRQILDPAAPYQAMRVVFEFGGVSGSQSLESRAPIGPLPELTDIGFLGKVAQATGAVSADFDVLMMRT